MTGRGPLRLRCDWPPSSSESITLREPVPPVPCLAPSDCPPIPRSFSRETGGSMSSTRRRAGRPDGAGSPEMLSDQPFFSPRVRGAYRVDSVVNSLVTWPVDPTDRVVIGPSALACYSAMRGLWRTRVTMTGGRRHSDHDVPSRRRHVSPSRSAHRFLPFRVALLSPCPPPCCAVSQGNWLVNSGNSPSPRGTPGRGRAPPILPLYHPLLPVQGRFSGEFTGYIGGLSDRPGGEMPTACDGRAPGAPPPG